MKGNVGVDGALILKPGKPMESVMWLRMHTPRDPGSDEDAHAAARDLRRRRRGLELVGDWISVDHGLPCERYAGATASPRGGRRP